MEEPHIQLFIYVWNQTCMPGHWSSTSKKNIDINRFDQNHWSLMYCCFQRNMEGARCPVCGKTPRMALSAISMVQHSSQTPCDTMGKHSSEHSHSISPSHRQLCTALPKAVDKPVPRGQRAHSLQLGPHSRTVPQS